MFSMKKFRVVMMITLALVLMFSLNVAKANSNSTDGTVSTIHDSDTIPTVILVEEPEDEGLTRNVSNFPKNHET